MLDQEFTGQGHFVKPLVNLVMLAFLSVVDVFEFVIVNQPLGAMLTRGDRFLPVHRASHLSERRRLLPTPLDTREDMRVRLDGQRIRDWRNILNQLEVGRFVPGN